MPRHQAPGCSPLAGRCVCCDGLQRTGRESRSDETSAVAGAPAYGDTFIQAPRRYRRPDPELTSDQSSHEIGGMIYDAS